MKVYYSLVSLVAQMVKNLPAMQQKSENKLKQIKMEKEQRHGD